MKRDDTSVALNTDNGGVLSRRLPVEAYRPVEAPLTMPTHRLDPVFDDWWRRLSSQVAVVAPWKRASAN